MPPNRLVMNAAIRNGKNALPLSRCVIIERTSYTATSGSISRITCASPARCRRPHGTYESHRRRAGDGLRHQPEDGGPRGLTDIHIFAVARHADDLQGVAIGFEHAPDRTLPRPELARQRFVDDDDRIPRRIVARIEHPPLDEGHAGGGEVFRADVHPEGGRVAPVRILRPDVRRDLVEITHDAHRRKRDPRGGFDTRQCGDPFAHAAIERQPLRRRRTPGYQAPQRRGTSRPDRIPDRRCAHDPGCARTGRR